MIRYNKRTSNIVTLTMDMEGRKSNIINHEVGRAFIPVLNHLKKDLAKGTLAGVILTSAKKSFLTGGDLDYLTKAEDPVEIFNFVQKQKELFRAIEKLEVPVVAAINGAALGSGYELALAANHRIAMRHPKTLVGLPEPTLGILPGGGGIIRLVWMLGIQKAFPILTQGKRYAVDSALKLGLIDGIASTREEMMDMAEAWIKENPVVKKPWDEKGGKIVGGTPHHPKIAQMVAMATAMLVKKTRNNYPAQQAILNTMIEGSLVDFETALRIESRYFTQLLLGKVAKNMTKAFWYDLNAIKAGENRPKGFGKFRPRKVGIIGAGMMGSGIAYVSAMVGLEVVLKDVSKPIAERGRAYSDKILSKMVDRDQITEARKQEVLSLITPTENASDFEGCDLVIEAVFENRALKSKVTKEAENYIDSETIFASNTSTLPITGLAKESSRPSKFIGLHFFSPVDKMKLVEIIIGEKTDDETLARAFDYVKMIRQIPIVVNDSRGFYTSRVFRTYLLEGMALLQEGHLPNTIEQAGLRSGMPVGPLALTDEVAISLIHDILAQEEKDLGDDFQLHPGIPVIKKMVGEFKRLGKAKGAGFYDYPTNEKKHLWKDLASHFCKEEVNSDLPELMDRLMIVQSLETVRCQEEGVVTSVADANIGSIYGWGFPAFKGGTLQFIEDYGLEKFIARANELAKKYGDRFEVPQLLLDQVK